MEYDTGGQFGGPRRAQSTDETSLTPLNDQGETHVISEIQDSSPQPFAEYHQQPPGYQATRERWRNECKVW